MQAVRICCSSKTKFIKKGLKISEQCYAVWPAKPTPTAWINIHDHSVVLLIVLFFPPIMSQGGGYFDYPYIIKIPHINVLNLLTCSFHLPARSPLFTPFGILQLIGDWLGRESKPSLSLSHPQSSAKTSVFLAGFHILLLHLCFTVWSRTQSRMVCDIYSEFFYQVAYSPVRLALICRFFLAFGFFTAVPKPSFFVAT